MGIEAASYEEVVALAFKLSGMDRLTWSVEDESTRLHYKLHAAKILSQQNRPRPNQIGNQHNAADNKA